MTKLKIIQAIPKINSIKVNTMNLAGTFCPAKLALIILIIPEIDIPVDIYPPRIMSIRKINTGIIASLPLFPQTKPIKAIANRDTNMAAIINKGISNLVLIFSI
jgi:hypothetical protein